VASEGRTRRWFVCAAWIARRRVRLARAMAGGQRKRGDCSSCEKPCRKCMPKIPSSACRRSMHGPVVMTSAGSPTPHLKRSLKASVDGGLGPIGCVTSGIFSGPQMKELPWAAMLTAFRKSE